MRLLIVSATQHEIADSIAFLKANNIAYLITGVGMVATSYSLTKHLSTQHYDLIINIGIAGSFDKSIPIGELVEINKDIFSELGAEDNEDFISIDALGMGTSLQESKTPPPISSGLTLQKGITVNTVHGCEKSIKRVQKRYPNASIESMEGAAVFFVATQFEIPAIQVRAISNYVEKRNKLTWNIPLAIQNINAWLVQFIQNVCNLH